LVFISFIIALKVVLLLVEASAPGGVNFIPVVIRYKVMVIRTIPP